MKFKTETDDYTTPKKGDYVLATDIKDEAMHNQVRDAFSDAGCKLRNDDYAQYCEALNRVSKLTYTEFGLMWLSTDNGRRIIPYQQNLFEAACEAEEGTRFKHDDWTGEFSIGWDGNLRWVSDFSDPEFAPLTALQLTDFEVIPSGPKKRDACVNELLTHVPRDMINECRDAFDLIGRLMQWEGAQIGKPGWFMCSGGVLACVRASHVRPVDVTFETDDQCKAAWKAECPEMFE